ncbi:MAG TPA: septum formation initiator family protein [Sphingomicrobium sp.]|nr:septum formation initiator family protein [Sphingomicrobium sp.]
MRGKPKSIGLIRRAVWPVVALLVVGTFAGHAIAGPNGLFAWRGYSQQLETRKAELSVLEAERNALRHKSALLDPRKADPDLADEMVRKDLGLIREDEVVVQLED